MAAGKMARFVSQDADDLIGRIRLSQGAVVHEDAAAVGNEGVEGGVVDDHDLDILFFETGRAQDRAGVVAQQLLCLGVAQQPRAALLGLCGPRPRQQRRRGHERGQAASERQAGPHSAVSRTMLRGEAFGWRDQEDICHGLVSRSGRLASLAMEQQHVGC